MDNVKKYPQDILDLLTLEGFNKFFEKEAECYKTQKEAYESTEFIYELYFGMRKYANFVSFKTARKYYTSKIRRKSKIRY